MFNLEKGINKDYENMLLDKGYEMSSEIFKNKWMLSQLYKK